MWKCWNGFLLFYYHNFEIPKVLSTSILNLLTLFFLAFQMICAEEDDPADPWLTSKPLELKEWSQIADFESVALNQFSPCLLPDTSFSHYMWLIEPFLRLWNWSPEWRIFPSALKRKVILKTNFGKVSNNCHQQLNFYNHLKSDSGA